MPEVVAEALEATKAAGKKRENGKREERKQEERRIGEYNKITLPAGV